MSELFIQGQATNYLLSISEVVNSVGKFADSNIPFIFQNEMLANLEDSQYSAVSAIVLEDAGPIGSLQLSRYRGRRLRLTVWANGTRDVLGNLIGSKAVYDKLADTFTVADKYMHRTSPETVIWEGIHTVSCDRITDLSQPVAITDGDGILAASAYYAVFF